MARPVCAPKHISASANKPHPVREITYGGEGSRRKTSGRSRKHVYYVRSCAVAWKSQSSRGSLEDVSDIAIAGGRGGGPGEGIRTLDIFLGKEVLYR